MKYSFVLILAAVSLMVSDVEAQTSSASYSAPVLIREFDYSMPATAIAAGIDGRILLHLKVDKNGLVTNVSVLAGPAWPCGSYPKKEIKEVIEGVKNAALRSRFSPAIKDGKPIDSETWPTYLLGNAYRAAVEQHEAEEAARKGISVPKLINSGVINGRAVSLPRPPYPSGAVAMRITGDVSVQVLIDEAGKVILAGTLSGAPQLQEAARSAACEAKFSHTSIGGNPVRVTGWITYSFSPPVRPVRPSDIFGH